MMSLSGVARNLAYRYAVLLGLMVSACAAQADTKPKAVISFCTTEWRPFVTVNAKGELGGTHYEALMKVFEGEGITVELLIQPWKRCLVNAEIGEVDGVLDASYQGERANYLLYPDTPLENVSYHFVTQANVETGWNEEKDLTTLPQPITAPSGWSISDLLAEAKGVDFYPAGQDTQKTLILVRNGRLGTGVVSGQEAQIIQETDPTLKVLSPAFTEPKPYFITISKRASVDGFTAQQLISLIDSNLPTLNIGEE